VLRAHEPLRHRRLRHEERARDLVRRQSAQRSQRERDLGIERKGRVAAGEDELKALVGDRRVAHGVLHGVRNLEQPGLLRERAIAPDTVDRPIPRGGDEPRARVVGPAVARPPLGGRRERLLDGFLGELEVAKEADQGREDSSPLVAEDLVEDR